MSIDYWCIINLGLRIHQHSMCRAKKSFYMKIKRKKIHFLGVIINLFLVVKTIIRCIIKFFIWVFSNLWCYKICVFINIFCEHPFCGFCSAGLYHHVVPPTWIHLYRPSLSFRELPFSMEMLPLWLKYMYSILSVLTERPMPPAVCSRLYSRVLAWVDVFARSTMSSV